MQKGKARISLPREHGEQDSRRKLSAREEEEEKEKEERARLKRMSVEAQSGAKEEGGLKHGLLLMSVALAAALVVTRSPWFIRGR